MKKLEYTKNKIKKVLKSNLDIYNFLEENKFKRLDGRLVFINKSKKIVVKSNYLCCKSIPKYSIPTVKFTYDDITWLIQPLAKTKLPHKQLTKIYDTLEKKINKTYVDFHTGNIGLYKNKAVLIDW